MLVNMKNNYMNEVSIQTELENVKIENYLEFYSDGRYEFYKCSGCFGPQLGHITAKCTKIQYEGDTVKAFEVYLKEIKGFKEALWKRDKEREKLRAKEIVEAAAVTFSSNSSTGWNSRNSRNSRRSSSDSKAKTTTTVDRIEV